MIFITALQARVADVRCSNRLRAGAVSSASLRIQANSWRVAHRLLPILINSYKHGDLSHVYPISRGIAPLMVAAVSVAFVGEVMTQQAGIAVVVIALGIMSLALTRGAEGFRNSKAMLFAVGTGVFIAGYTVVDGLGARLAHSAESYKFWSHLLNGIPIALIALYLRKGRVLVSVTTSWKVGFLGGMVSLLAYWIVTWAMTQAPMAMVSAVREPSMVFAVLFGVILSQRAF